MPKAPADVRLARLLDIVPWIASHDGPRIDDVCLRFDISEPELLAELNLLFLCGLYPFTPDMLIDVDVADGRVWVRMADYFRRPLRLSPQEGMALASAASALLDVPGADLDGALATALAKLETVLGVAADDGLEVELGPAPAGMLEELRRAADARRKVRIDYYSFGRDGHSTRVVHPWRVVNAAGNWYLQAWCEAVRAERIFRVDRMTAPETLDETFDPPDALGEVDSAVYHPRPDDPLVVIDLDPPAHWVAEQYPNEDVAQMPGGVLRLSLRVAGRAWLERLLLRGGPDIRIVEGDPDLGPAAARRLLARYRR
ncbi:MAG TPA: WYL domain-containing protein [Acidimicrobiales bacterium]|nr:WYL domain-containing protein [Acidimicrobiales bacterium]